MTRMTPELDRLAAARPETARRAAALADDGERQRLLAAIMADDQPQRSRQLHHRWLMTAAPAAASALGTGRRHRPMAFAAGAVAVAAGAAVAVPALTTAGQQAGRQPTAQLAAWTVSKLADGNISVTIRQLKDPAGLQSTLRADGAPASITFTGRQNPACRAYPAGTPRPGRNHRATPLLKRVFPVPYHGLPAHFPRPPRGAAPRTTRASGTNSPPSFSSKIALIVIRPSALPGNAGVQIAVSYAGPRGPFAVDMPGLVYASAQCTDS